jgi:dTDP-4-dehydrorhamnose reductase
MALKKKIFVTGSGGMVGSKFVELYKEKYNLLLPEIEELDLTDKSAVTNFIQKESPNAIIHFAAYTDVSEAEKQRGDRGGPCHKANVDATRNLVETINPNVTHFIHISTDYVFSGSDNDPGPYDEFHKPESDPDKLTWYGYTKKLAEDVVKNILVDKYTILRFIYPVRTGYDKKLDPQVRMRLKLFDEGKLFPLFDDQIISITLVDEICLTLEKIIDRNIYGIFHACSNDTTTPYELGKYLIEKTRGKGSEVKKASIKKYLKNTTDKPRWPIYGGLKVDKTQKQLKTRFRNWKEIIDYLISNGLK